MASAPASAPELLLTIDPLHLNGFAFVLDGELTLHLSIQFTMFYSQCR